MTGDYSNELDVISNEPSLGLKFGFLKNGKTEVYLFRATLQRKQKLTSILTPNHKKGS